RDRGKNAAQDQSLEKSAIHPFEYASIGGHEQTRFLSPYTWLSRPTDGQNLCARTHGSGYAACCREYGRFHSSAGSTSAVCGAPFSTLSCASALPLSISAISRLIEIIASQKRSNSLNGSLSVGSIIKVPITGKLVVGAWKP